MLRSLSVNRHRRGPPIVTGGVRLIVTGGVRLILTGGPPRRAPIRILRRGRRLRTPVACDSGQIGAGVVHFSTYGRVEVYRTTLIEAGSATIRWNPSRCAPRASARTDLMTSPCVQATHTTSRPCSSASRASCSRTAATARAWTCARPSPREHRGGRVLLHDLPQRFLEQDLQLATGPLAVVDLDQPIVPPRGQAPARGERFHGLLAPHERRMHDLLDGHVGEPATRCACACSRPRSSSSTPGDRPASVCAVFEVDRPWRSSTTVIGPA